MLINIKASCRTFKTIAVIAVAVTMAGSALFAGHHIRTTSIWYDEAITLLTVAGHAVPDWSLGSRQFEGFADFAQILTDLYRVDVHPPLYFWTVAIWRVLAGSSIESIRFLSALFIVASIWLLYRVATMFPMKWPAVPALIYAFSGAAVGYGYTARSYAMAEFLIVLTMYCAQRKSAWTGVVAASCIAAHYFSALCIVPILLFYCYMRWTTDRRWSILTACSFGVLTAILLPLLLVHLRARPDQYAGTASLVVELRAVLIGSFLTGFPCSSVVLVRYATLLTGTAYVLVGTISSVRHRATVVALTLVAFISGFFFLSLVTHKPIANMPVSYYFGFIAPFLALLIGFGVDAIPQIAPLLAGLLIISIATAVPIIPLVNYRNVIAEIRPHCEDCIVVVGAGYGRGVPGSVVYEAGSIPVLVLDSRSFASVIDRAGKFRSVYLIPSNEAVTAPFEQEFTAIYKLRPASGYFGVVPGN